MNIDREGAKWLKLTFETHGPVGATEMAAALGLPTIWSAARVRGARTCGRAGIRLGDNRKW